MGKTLVLIAVFSFVCITLSYAETLKTFRARSLKAANAKRSQAGLKALTMNDELNRSAQKWAQHLSDTGSNELSYKSTTGKDLLELFYRQFGNVYYLNKIFDAWSKNSMTSWVLLSAEHTQMGIGRVYDGKKYTFIAAFW